MYFMCIFSKSFISTLYLVLNSFILGNKHAKKRCNFKEMNSKQEKETATKMTKIMEFLKKNSMIDGVHDFREKIGITHTRYFNIKSETKGAWLKRSEIEKMKEVFGPRFVNFYNRHIDGAEYIEERKELVSPIDEDLNEKKELLESLDYAEKYLRLREGNLIIKEKIMGIRDEIRKDEVTLGDVVVFLKEIEGML